MKFLIQFLSVCTFLTTSGYTTLPAAEQSTEIENQAEDSHATARLQEWLDSRFQQAVQQQNIPSLAVGVIRDGEPFRYFNYGRQARDSGTPVDQHSIYQIASLSKMFTGLITNQLVRDGVLEPQEPIATYLSSVISKTAADNLHAITLDQLLHHQSGIIDQDCSLYRDRMEGEPWLHDYTRAELLTDINQLQLQADAEPEFQYSSCGYSIVGLIDELVTGKNYASLLEQRVTSVYNMQDTTVTLNDQQRSRLVVPYRKTDRNRATQASIMGMGTPASAVYSTVADLLNLQVQHIQAYREFAQHGVEHDLILTRRTVAGRGIRFGEHLLVVQTPSGRLFLHDGDADGFASLYVFNPEHNVGMVLLTSSGGRWFGELSVAAITGIMDKVYLDEPATE